VENVRAGRDRLRRISWLTIFAAAMGVLEAIVVIYLRELYYPGGFKFPVVLVSTRIAVTEIAREAATLAMLLAVAVLAGRGAFDRFAVFAYLFGIWDIIYYIFLHLFLGWPSSLLEWDVLFLIPLPWLAPVIYPVIVSVGLITMFAVHEILKGRGRGMQLSLAAWLTASAGAGVVVLSFCWNWRAVVESRTPSDFPVWLFAGGLLACSLPFVLAALKALRNP
jgi:hypothetical protein